MARIGNGRKKRRKRVQTMMENLIEPLYNEHKTKSRGGSRLVGDLPQRQVHMYYVYILLSEKSKRLYTGYTDNLKRRFQEHNYGKGGAYTNKNKPFKLIFYEAFLAKKDAIKQEKFYKSGYGKEVLKQKIEHSLNAAVVQW